MTRHVTTISCESNTGSTSPFDRIRQIEAGREYWSARDLQKLMGYVEWRKFEDAIERAIIACQNSGQAPSDHFGGAAKLQKRGNRGGIQKVNDYHLTRYACYLVAMNGDPRKVEVSQAQTYFAFKTREAELAQLASAPSLASNAALSLLTEIAGKLDTIIAHLEGGQGSLRAPSILGEAAPEPVQRFLSERCLENPGSQVRSCHLYETYVTWSHAHHLEPISQTAFGLGVKRCLIWKRVNVGVVYCGLQLKG